MGIDIGTVVDGRWKLVGFLANGGMADLYRGRDVHTDTMVAVKILRRGVRHGEHRFAAEVSTLRRLRHPNIVSLVDAGEHEGSPYLVLDLVPGRSLSTVLDERTLSESEVRRMGSELARALAFAHDNGITHRDVKPGNVIFDADGSVKLADFGLALHDDAERITGSDGTIGTASYIAPEQLEHRQKVGNSADIYALGLLLIESMTGERAFSGPTDEAALARLSSDPRMPAELDEGWRSLLLAMTSRDPRDRPDAATVASLIEDGPTAGQTRPLLHAPPDDVTQPLPMAGSPVDGAADAVNRDDVVVLPWPRTRVLASVSVLGFIVLAAAFLYVTGTPSGGDSDAEPAAERGVDGSEVDTATERDVDPQTDTDDGSRTESGSQTDQETGGEAADESHSHEESIDEPAGNPADGNNGGDKEPGKKPDAQGHGQGSGGGEGTQKAPGQGNGR